MPIYAFECAACGHQFERLQKLSDADPSQCPVCAAEGVRRQLTAPSFRLAGSGWYETDFKKDGDKKRNLVDAPASAAAGEGKATAEAAASGKGEAKAKPEGKPDPKPEAKPAPKSEPAAKPAPPAKSGD